MKTIKIVKTCLLLFLVLFLGCQDEYLTELQTTEPDLNTSVFQEYTRDQINERTGQIIAEKGKVFWNDYTDAEFVSAFKLSGTKAVMIVWNDDEDDDAVRSRIENELKTLEPQYKSQFDNKNSFVVPEFNLMEVYIDNPETLIKMRHLPQVRSVDLYYSMFTEEEAMAFKSASSKEEKKKHEIKKAQKQISCSSSHVFWDTFRTEVEDNVHGLDCYFGVTRALTPPFGSGAGIKVAVIDVGPNTGSISIGYSSSNNIPSATTDLKSYFRPIPKVQWWWSTTPNISGNYYESQYDWLNTSDEHGSWMILNVNADFSQWRSIASKSEVISYKASNSVVYDFANWYVRGARQGIIESFQNISENDDIKIVSISMGSLIGNTGIENAIKSCTNEGKIVVAAAGSMWDYVQLISPFIGGKSFTLFPASMPEVYAATGGQMNSSGNLDWAPGTFGKADFVVEINPNNNSSSFATSLTASMMAAIWSDNPGFSADDVIGTMANAADYPNNPHTNFGYGRVDLSKYVNSIISTP